MWQSKSSIKPHQKSTHSVWHTSGQMESWGRHWSTHCEDYLRGCLLLRERRQSHTQRLHEWVNEYRMNGRDHMVVFTRGNDTNLCCNPLISSIPGDINQHLRTLRYIILELVFQTYSSYLNTLNWWWKSGGLASQEPGSLSTLEMVVLSQASG